MSIFVISGLGFGDEGKGSVTDYLCRRFNAKLCVRHSGGSQCGHNVVTDDHKHHVFSQFGSGTLTGVPTHLSRFMMVNPITFLSEERSLSVTGFPDAAKGVTVEATALITTPFHIATNRLKEMARGDGRHGSCGMGIGETASDSVTFSRGSDDVIEAGDLLRPEALRRKLQRIQERKREECKKNAEVNKILGEDFVKYEWDILSSTTIVSDVVEQFGEFLRSGVTLVDESWLPAFLKKDPRSTHTIFEGAQGALLDEWYGFHPNTTWSTLTLENVRNLIPKDLYNVVDYVKRWGVLRTFATRHGAGPFPTHTPGSLPWKSWASYYEHNVTTPWQHGFRCGNFDMVLAQYAVKMMEQRGMDNGLDGLCITHMDTMLNADTDHIRVCEAYTADLSRIEGHEDLFGTKLGLMSYLKEAPMSLKPGDALLARQEAIGKALAEVTPVYNTIPKFPKTFVGHLEEKLHLPVKLLSYGRCPKDKFLV